MCASVNCQQHDLSDQGTHRAGPIDDSSSDDEPIETGMENNAEEAEDDAMHVFSGHTGLSLCLITSGHRTVSQH